MAFIHLIRHGQASFGSEDYDQLSELGARQGEVLAGRFANTIDKCTHVVCGDLKRHKQTADAFQNKLALPEVEINPQWNEFDHMDVIKCYNPELSDRKAPKDWMSAQPETRRSFQHLYSAATERWISGEHDEDYTESRTAFTDRVFEGLDGVASKLSKGATALVFTSGGPISAIAQKVLELSDTQVRGVESILVNTGVTTLSVRDGNYRLLSLNCYGHLEMDHDSLITYR